jgi:hypothetical protein
VRIAVSVRRAARPTRAAEKMDVSTPFKNVPPRDQAPVDVTFYLLKTTDGTFLSNHPQTPKPELRNLESGASRRANAATVLSRQTDRRRNLLRARHA